jgi:integrase
MPRQSSGPHLWFDKARGTWTIVDGKHKQRTGFGKADRGAATKALENYLSEQHSPEITPSPTVADVLAIYGAEHAPTVSDGGYIIGCRIGSLLEWWGDKVVKDVTTENCRAYTKHREKENARKAVEREIAKARKEKRKPDIAAAEMDAPSGTTGARGDLEVLRSAINYYHAEKTPLAVVPVVWLPQKPEGRDQWLTREQIARFLWAARRTVENLEVDPEKKPRLVRRLCRFILLAFYTGSRSGVVVGTRYRLLDFDNDFMQRKPRGSRQTKKKAPPHKMPKRLKSWLLRWQRIDGKAADYVVHLGGEKVLKMRKAWAGARDLAELPDDITPHTLRHSRATHLMRNRKVANEDAAQFMGMTLQTFLDTYGHHDPDWQKDAADAR